MAWSEFGSNCSFEKYVGQMDGTDPWEKILQSFALRNGSKKIYL